MIADDEAIARARLRRLLSDEPDIEIVSECEDGVAAAAAIVADKPDLVFLDIQMPGLNGLEVLRSVPDDVLPHFVFVTAFKEYALDAFTLDALDYILKPFDADRLHATLDRVRERRSTQRPTDRSLIAAVERLTREHEALRAAITAVPGSAGTPVPQYLDRITVKADGRTFFVRTSDIDYIESAANYVRLRVGNATHMVREPIGVLAARLDPHQFARIHRTTIINIDRIKEIQPWFSGDAIVILRDGQRLRLSRHYRDALELSGRSRRS